MTNSLTRRSVLRRSGALIGAAVVAGCSDDDPDSGSDADGETTGDRDPSVTTSESTLDPGSRSYYLEHLDALETLREPWEGTAQTATEEYVRTLEEELAYLLLPGLEDLLPGESGDVATLVDTTATAFELLADQQLSYERETVRSKIRVARAGDSEGRIDDYYERIGIPYDQTQSRPYYPLFTALVTELRPARESGADAVDTDALGYVAGQVHALLVAYVLPHTNTVEGDAAEPLAHTLEVLSVIAGTLEQGASRGGDDGGSGTFELDFADPPAELEPYVQKVGSDAKLVVRNDEVWYDLPDTTGWTAIEYTISGQGAGNTAIGFSSAEQGGYSSFLGIRPWMRWRSAIPDWNGGRSYSGIDWTGAQTETEYRVRLERTGSATAEVTVYADGDPVHTPDTEAVFNVFDDPEATFVPDRIRFASNDDDERGVFGDVAIEGIE